MEVKPGEMAEHGSGDRLIGASLATPSWAFFWDLAYTVLYQENKVKRFL